MSWCTTRLATHTTQHGARNQRSFNWFVEDVSRRGGGRLIICIDAAYYLRALACDTGWPPCCVYIAPTKDEINLLVRMEPRSQLPTSGGTGLQRAPHTHALPPWRTCAPIIPPKTSREPPPPVPPTQQTLLLNPPLKTNLPPRLPRSALVHVGFAKMNLLSREFF